LQRDDVIGKLDGAEYHIAHARSLHVLHGIQITAFFLSLRAATANYRELILQMNRGDQDLCNKTNQAISG